MRVRLLAGFVGFALVLGVVALGGYGVIRYVIRPAAAAASGPVPDPGVREVPAGPNITFSTTTVAKANLRSKASHQAAANRLLAAAGKLLAAAAPGQARDVVAADGSFEAATYDQYGHINFWREETGHWVGLAQRLYPPDAGNGSMSYSSTGAVSVTGQVLVGMTEPIYIVSGHFSSDGSDNSLAFSDGPAGWGVVVEQASGVLSSDGESLTDQGTGLNWEDRFVAGRFETLQRPAGWTPAFDSEFPVTQLWSWATSGFNLVTSNVVTAALASAPPSAAALPTGGAIPDGTYAGRLIDVTAVGSSIYPLLRLEIEPGIVTSCAGGQGCFEGYGGETSVVVGSTTTTSYAVTSNDALAWVSGPAWGLAVPGGICCSGGYHVTPAQLDSFGASSWYVPSQLGVTSFVEGPQPVLELTFRGGAATAMAESVNGYEQRT
jgi:hypothetical protein